MVCDETIFWGENVGEMYIMFYNEKRLSRKYADI